MRFIKAKYEIWEPKECNSKNILEAIERAAKVCYKSEGNIKEGSALPFVKGLIKRGHTSCLEHGNIYLFVNEKKMHEYWNNRFAKNLKMDSYIDFVLKCRESIDKTLTYSDYRISGKYIANGDEPTEIYLYTNARFVYEKCPKLFWDIILDRELPNFISLFTPEKNDPYRRQTVFFTADQRITEEFIRHRVASPNKESTRYCVYSSDKHGNELTFIIPPRLYGIINEGDKITLEYNDDTDISLCCNGKKIESKEVLTLLQAFMTAELSYISMVNEYGWRAEEARVLLPLDVKADLVLTNSLIDWYNGRTEPVDDYEADVNNGEVKGKRIKGFFGLRCDSAAHPQARELAISLMDEFTNLKYV